MTSDNLDRTPIEHDPTGVRDLLAGLPDPGPMPAEVTDRILAALAQARDTQVTDGSGHVIPLADARIAREAQRAEQAHRVRSMRINRWFASAAAVAVVALAANALVSNRYGSWSAALGGSSMAAGSSAVAASDQIASRAAGEAASGSGHVQILSSGRQYSADTLGAVISGLSSTSLDYAAPPDEPLATPTGARDCATELGIAPDEPLLVDLGRSLSGEPVAAIVAESSRTAYLVARSCTTGNATLIAGPIALGP